MKMKKMVVFIFIIILINGCGEPDTTESGSSNYTKKLRVGFINRSNWKDGYKDGNWSSGLMININAIFNYGSIFDNNRNLNIGVEQELYLNLEPNREYKLCFEGVNYLNGDRYFTIIQKSFYSNNTLWLRGDEFVEGYCK